MSRSLTLVVVLAVSLVLWAASFAPALARPSDAATIAARRGRPTRPPTPPPPPPPVETVPKVLAVSPTGAGVNPATTIAVTFSEAMNTNSAQLAFSVSPSASGSFSWSGNTMRYSPADPLTAQTTYTVTLAATAQSALGVSLAAPVSWTFATAAPPPPQPLKISCAGDSITEGKYPATLQSVLGSAYQVGNFGSGGTCVVISNGGVAVPYISTAVCNQAQQFQPSTVVIMLGTNDSDPLIYKRIDRFVADYKQLVRQFQALPSHPKIWLVKPPAIYGTPYGLSNTNLVNGVIPRIQQVANEMGLPIIDLYSATAGHPEYFTDGVHPNTTGAAVIANVIANAIKF